MLSRMRNSLPAAAALVAAVSIMASPATAQSMAATLSGTVKDPADAVGARAPRSPSPIGPPTSPRSLMTNETGLFVAPDVDPGHVRPIR